MHSDLRLWKTIHLENLRHNVVNIRQYIRPRHILAVVKADAYGHGSVTVAQALAEDGVRYFGVASVAEALALRKAGITGEIIILGSLFSSEIPLLTQYRLTPTVSSYKEALAIQRTSAPCSVHVKVDTGMGRFGLPLAEAVTVIRAIHALPGISITGIFSHFATADVDPVFSDIQLARFEAVLMALRQHCIVIPYVHMANSAGILSGMAPDFNMVRLGLLLYGLRPPGSPELIKVRPVLELCTRLVFIKSLAPGDSVSYGRHFVAQKPMTLAVLPVGYRHGFPRALSNQANVSVRGVLAPVVGAVCMDYTMIDITHIPQSVVGDVAILIGRDGTVCVTVEAWCAHTGLIPYEVLCGLHGDIDTVVIKGGRKHDPLGSHRERDHCPS